MAGKILENIKAYCYQTSEGWVKLLVEFAKWFLEKLLPYGRNYDSFVCRIKMFGLWSLLEYKFHNVSLLESLFVLNFGRISSITEKPHLSMFYISCFSPKSFNFLEWLKVSFSLSGFSGLFSLASGRLLLFLQIEST